MTVFPKRLAALRALTAHLEGINPDQNNPFSQSPYDIDLRGKVVRGKTVIGSGMKTPFLSILEAPVPAEGFFAGDNRVETTLKVLLQGFAEDDAANPTDPAYFLQATVEQRLSLINAQKEGRARFPDFYFLNGAMVGFTIHPGVVRPPEGNVSPTAFFYTPLTIKLTYDVTNPYAT
jgi:hypothetical protein